VIHVTSTLLPHPLAPSKATSEIILSLDIIGTNAQQLVSCIKFESRSHKAEKRIGYFKSKATETDLCTFLYSSNTCGGADGDSACIKDHRKGVEKVFVRLSTAEF
jgi:hypothetical protein